LNVLLDSAFQAQLNAGAQLGQKGRVSVTVSRSLDCQKIRAIKDVANLMTRLASEAALAGLVYLSKDQVPK
jgi:hypothetical protein